MEAVRQSKRRYIHHMYQLRLKLTVSADRMQSSLTVRSEREADARITLTGVRYFEVGRLLNPLPRFVNNLLAILFGKRSFLTFR
ncbi:hypothetical protein SE2072C2_31020 [Salmonella enterica]|uniref:Uncharacterized protein n=1 Tax=Salmonella enterica I TaxID=59201 RepID=A0A379UNN3_SALET|nr:hypothetical protein SE2072C2_31020 [Salmonella enterica]SUG68986.1 Uncharacterised protein [Salmonella enterica subsp. enterica]